MIHHLQNDRYRIFPAIPNLHRHPITSIPDPLVTRQWKARAHKDETYAALLRQFGNTALRL